MIINDKFKFIYYAPGKTGSTSVHFWLNDNYPGTKQHPKGKHYCKDISDYHEYFSFVTVRNPWRRIVSDYRYRHNRHLRPGSFETFVLKTLPTFNDYVYQLLKDIRIDRYVRIEYLNQDMGTLPFINEDVIIPHLNHNKKNELVCLFSKEMQNAVINGCEDFELGGYSRGCPEDLVK